MIYILLFPNKYRASQIDLTVRLQENRKRFIAVVSSPIVFKLFKWICGVFPMEWLPFWFIVSDYRPKSPIKNLTSIWWNDIREIGEPSVKDFFVCKFPYVDCKFMPILPESGVIKATWEKIDPSCNPSRIVFYGEPSSTAKSANFSNEIINSKDILPIYIEEFWKKSRAATHERASEFAKFNENLRAVYLEALDALFDNLDVYGSGWVGILKSAKHSDYSTAQRIDSYHGNICVDFGSKCSSSALYPRAIEIIKSGGFWVHLIKPDSTKLLGNEFVENFGFGNICGLVEVIQRLSVDIESRELYIDLIMKSVDSIDWKNNTFSYGLGNLIGEK